MEKGQSFATKLIERELKPRQDEIAYYLNSVLKRSFLTVNDPQHLPKHFFSLWNEYQNNLPYEQFQELQSYRAISFRNMNAHLRDSWTYDFNGQRTDEEIQKNEKAAKVLEKAINRFPSLDTDFKTYRGVSLSAFSKYGIQSVDDLLSLKDHYYYDEGFTSTALLPQDSFFHKNVYGEPRNIEIEYLIPSESEDGALIINQNANKETSLTFGEYLLQRCNISKIIDVQISPDHQHAHLTAILIPKSIHHIYTHETDEELQLK